MAATVSVESRVPLAQAWAWWTDFGAVGSESVLDHGMGRTRRTVKARWGNRIVLEERPDVPGGRHLPPFRHSVDLDTEARLFVETAATYEARWTFEATPSGGTRITRALRPKGVGRLAPDLLSRKAMERDLRTHVAEMERELAGPSG